MRRAETGSGSGSGSGLSKSIDLVAIGRSSVDLYGQQIGGRLEDMASFAKYIGGSPTNTAVGVARLGLKSALVSRVGAEHMGSFIREQLDREGVDTCWLITDPERLTALVILGIRDRETFPLIFYRDNCADMALTEADIDRDLMESAAAVLINGTHLSTPTVSTASILAARTVRDCGGRVVFDIDYRPVLWGLAGKGQGEDRFVPSNDVTDRLQQVLPLCDLIVGTEEEIHILGGSTATIIALENIRRKTDALLVCKLGPGGCVAFPGKIPDDITDGTLVRGFPVEVFNVLGAGDAFMAGFLSGWLRDEPLEQCCRLGNACGAIVVSRHGCAPAMPTAIELAAFLGRDRLPFRLREDRELSDLHWATTRSGNYDELTILAIDHRSQFDEIMAQVSCSEQDVARFKRLAFDVLHTVAGGDRRFGIIVDQRFGADVLSACADLPYWTGRPIEVPKSRPLAFEGDADVGLELASWPLNQAVKCLAFFDAADPPEIRERQERQLSRLFDACRKTGHELLMEVIAPPEFSADEQSTARTLRHLYEVGIRPDWWKLEPHADPATWKDIVDVIEERDPYCRGVVMLGLSSPVDDLIGSFEAAAAYPLIKGFAVGRTIFHDVARPWLGGEINNAQATEVMETRLSALVEGWRRARARVGQAA